MPFPAFSIRRALLPLLVIPATSPAAAAGQGSSEVIGAGLSHSQVLAVNVLVGAFTAGLVGALRGEDADRRPTWRDILHGAAGGGIHYGGKVVASMEWTGSGFLGRQVAGIGSSVVLNAGRGAEPFEELIFPAWGLRLHVRPGADDGSRMVVDLSTVLTLARGVIDGSDLAVGTSLSTGALVLEGVPSWAERDVAGASTAGVVYVDDARGLRGRSVTLRQVLSHENVHVAQHDFAMTVWGVETDRVLLGATGEGRIRDALRRHVATGLYLVPKNLLQRALDPEDRPWEWEAYFLDSYPQPGGGGRTTLSEPPGR